MSPHVATVVYALGILGLFALDRDRSSRTSKALWIPVMWLWIVGSREVSQWLAALGVGQARTLFGSPNQDSEGGPVERWILQILFGFGLFVLGMRPEAMVI